MLFVILVLAVTAALLVPLLAGVMVFTAYLVGVVGRFGDRKAAAKLVVDRSQAFGEAAAREVFAAEAEGRTPSVASMRRYL